MGAPGGEGQGKKKRTFGRRTFLKGAGAGTGLAMADLTILKDVASAAPNAVATENALAGDGGWDVGTDASIEGFATQYSVNAGEQVDFKINTDATSYKIDIYRIGWYGGAGGRLITTINPTAALAQDQPPPFTDTFTGLVDAGNWRVSASWAVPANALSGVYCAVLTRLDDTGLQNLIQFVVRNDGRVSDILLQTCDTTYTAYNDWGGYSLYAGTSNYGRAVKVSYNRPLSGTAQLENNFFYAESPMVRWLERNGYDVSYTAGIDTATRPAEITKHKIWISSGHDEYWSGAMRTNVEAARAAGVNLIFMTGNECFWRTRWEPSSDGTSTPNRTMVCYKETLDGAKTDPTSEWTGTWRDPRFTSAPNGSYPENSLTGTYFRAIDPVTDPDFNIKVPYAYSKLRIWRNTTVASLTAGSTATLANGTLGYEWNTDEDNPTRPPGLIRLSETTNTADQVLQDYGRDYKTAPLTHYMTMYKATSGALVWSTGTVQWCWGLDATHWNRPDADIPEDSRMQQATMNVLADMGAQPTNRQSNLAAASKSTDTTKPVSAISSPANNATVQVGSAVTVSGTASDVGGVVAGVEYRIGTGPWLRATGTTSWSFVFTPTVAGAVTVQTRAIDDSCNVETPSAGRTYNAAGAFSTLWANSTVPGTVDGNDTGAIEVGLRFRADAATTINGLRFYKSLNNTGTHVGHLWSNTGTLLATVTFSGESGSGWQAAAFSSPVTLSANTTYVASVYCPNGHYSADSGFFNAELAANGLRGLANGADGANGVYKYGSGGVFPTDSYGAANYWVDVMVATTGGANDVTAPVVVNADPTPNINAVVTTAKPAATLSEAMQAATVAMELRNTATNALIAGSAAYDAASRKVTFSPSAALPAGTQFTAKVSGGKDTNGNLMTAYSWNFTTKAAAGSSPSTLWDSSSVPVNPAANDGSAVEVGFKFTSDYNGKVAGVRFYKGPGNIGTHVGHLWNAGGTLLGTVTFAGETAGGWQQANFSTPVTVTANTVYVASVYCPVGHYAADSGGFSGPLATDALHGLASGVSGPNGVYHYGSGGGFPSDAFGDANYWVDVVLTWSAPADTQAPAVTSTLPAKGLAGVGPGLPVQATFNEAIKQSTLVFSLTPSGGSAVAATVTYDSASNTAKLTPNAALAANTTYTASVKASDNANNAMASAYTWPFTTASTTTQGALTLFDTSVQPATAAVSDTASVKLGVQVTPAVDGYVTGVRFYKGPGNTGAHVGHLWSSAGTLLASANFTTESAGDWQQVAFTAPIPVSAGTTVVASYLAPVGRYSTGSTGFSSPYTAGPLTVPANGGVFAYGAGGFPNESFGGGNYLVDLVFVVSTRPLVVSTAPTNGANGVAVRPTISATFDQAVTGTGITFLVKDQNGNTVATTAVSYNSSTKTASVTPSADLAPGKAHTVTVSGAKNSGGEQMQPYTFSFTTAISGTTVSLFPTATPANPAANDTGAVELGVRFTSSVDGKVLGIRFYKGSGNTGTHIGSLWTNNGTKLASATFVSESASGWQVVTFATPVDVTANTNYVASYYAPNGHYAADGGGLASAVTSGPLTALADSSATPNGLYMYGANSTFPSNTYGSANYWVDVVFQATS